MDPSSNWRGKSLLIVWPLPEDPSLTEKIEQSTGAHVSWHQGVTKIEDESIFKKIEILVTLGVIPSSREVAPNLQLCHLLTAGTDHAARSQLFKDASVRWTYSSGIHGVPIAEWVLGTYIAFQKDFAARIEDKQARKWRGLEFAALRKQRDLLGQRVGIIGYGSIGRQVAKIASAFGMEVLAYTASEKDTAEKRRENGYRLPGTGDPDGRIPKGWFHGTDKKSLHHFLAQRLELLVLLVPITDQTRGFIGEEEFEVLRWNSPFGGAFISNVARGDVIVQDELIEALNTEDSGVRGAALDVQSPEPLPEDSPLWDAKNCFISPHNSSNTIEYLERGVDILLENLRKRDGERWINEIYIEKGY